MANTLSYQSSLEQQTSVPVMSTPVIQIGHMEAFVGIVVFLVGLVISWGTLRAKLDHVASTLKDKIEPDLMDVREKFTTVKDRVETLWQDRFAPSRSPRQLNERGENVLRESGITHILSRIRLQLLDEIKTKNPANAYDAEQVVLEVVSDITKHHPEVLDELKNGAFRVGENIDTVLLVGGIHLRNEIFPELGFSLTDLDMPTHSERGK
ncbi:MAG: hypothetical protein AAB381_02030 [Patescibacteria group bacterium]